MFNAVLIAMEMASWFDSAFSAVVSALVLVGAVFAAAIVAAVVALVVSKRVNETTRIVLEELRETVRKERGTSVPAFATLIGSFGIAGSELLPGPPWVGFVSAAVAAIATYLFSCLAQNPQAERIARWFGVVGSITPFVALVAAMFLSDGFADLSPETQVVVAGTIVVAVVGLASGVERLWEMEAGKLQATESQAMQRLNG
jgi:hypothetical protein